MKYKLTLQDSRGLTVEAQSNDLDFLLRVSCLAPKGSKTVWWEWGDRTMPDGTVWGDWKPVLERPEEVNV
jgi:hypothetical protein